MLCVDQPLVLASPTAAYHTVAARGSSVRSKAHCCWRPAVVLGVFVVTLLTAAVYAAPPPAFAALVSRVVVPHAAPIGISPVLPQAARHCETTQCATAQPSDAHTPQSANAAPVQALHSRRAVGAVLVGAALASAAEPAAAAESGRRPMDVRALTRSGMAKFEKGDVRGSLQDFDAVLAAQPRMAPYMWQRGLSLYYAEALEEVVCPLAVVPSDPCPNTRS